jgi:hypothetical protein
MANWIQFMGLGARFIMIVLLLLSVWSVGIMIDRRKVFNKELGSVKAADGMKKLGRFKRMGRRKPKFRFRNRTRGAQCRVGSCGIN